MAILNQLGRTDPAADARFIATATRLIPTLTGAVCGPRTGDRQLGCSRGIGYAKALVAIGDATRLSCDAVLSAEKQTTPVVVLLRAVAGSVAPLGEWPAHFIPYLTTAAT